MNMIDKVADALSEHDELGIREFAKVSVLTVIIEQMKELTGGERLEIISSFCRHCGSNDPRCQCWNDE